jgi:hypothetical protein
MVRNVWNEVVWGWVGHGSRTLFRTDAFWNSGGFVPGISLAEDRDLWVRLARLGPVVLVPDVVLDKRAHTGDHPYPNWEMLGLEVVRRRLAELPADEQRRGERIVDARIHYSEGLRRLADGRPLGAARELVRLTRAPAGMLVSPLFRQQLLSHLGRYVATAVRRSSGVRHDA